MPQYRTGTVTVDNTEVVVGSGTAWLSAGLLPGDPFIVTTNKVPYYVASIDTDLQLTLSAPYAGTPGAGLAYVVGGQFTENLNLPYPEPNDIEIASTLKRALLGMDAFDLSFTYYAWASDDSGTDFTLTFDAALNYQAILRPAAEIASPAAGDFAGLWKNVKGATGDQGISSGLSYVFNSDTAASDPGAGKLKFDNADPATATTLRISETDANSVAVAALLATWDDSTTADLRGTVKITKKSDPAVFYVYSITAPLTDGGAYDSFTIAFVSGAGTLTDTDPVDISFARTGDKGADSTVPGPTGPAWDQWKGAWVDITDYIVLDGVSNEGGSYIATAPNGPGTSVVEPGVTAGWESYWDVTAAKGADGAGTGDVVGPAESVDSELALFSGVTGKLLKRYSVSGLIKSVAGVISAVVSGTDVKTINGESILGSGDIAVSSSNNADSLTHLLHPTLDGNFRDTYRAGALPSWFNQQWGGAQWGGLPDGSFGSVATGQIEHNSASALGDSVGRYYLSQGFKVAESFTLDAAWLKLYKIGNPTGNLTARIYTDSAGSPSAAFGSATTFSCKLITSKTDGEWYQITGLAAALTAGVQYHLVLTLGTTDASNCLGWPRDTVSIKYPYGYLNEGTSGPSWTAQTGRKACFLIQNPAANSLIQPGGMFGNYKLAFNSGSPVNQSRSLAQPLSQFHDGKECSVIHRGTYAASSNVWDFSYGLDHDRITVTVDASGYPVLSIYEADRTLAQVTGTGDITTGDHDVAIKVRTVGDGADYAYLYVDGASVGTPLTSQTFTMSKEMRELGTARLGDGFGIIPAWTQDMQMTSLPSAQGLTWAGTGTEANCWSVSGGKGYQNANGYTSTQTGNYYKTVSFVNSTGGAVVWKGRVAYDNNASLTNGFIILYEDAVKALYLMLHEYFFDIYTPTAGKLASIQVDLKSQENVILVNCKGSDCYVHVNGKLLFDGTGLLTGTTANNRITFGDSETTAGYNSDVVTSYVKYYQGGMILPIANNRDCSEFAHWSGDKSALFAPLWNAGNPVSVKQLCGVEKNYIGEGVVQQNTRKGASDSFATSATTPVLIPEMESYVIGDIITCNFSNTSLSPSAGGVIQRFNSYLDGEQATDMWVSTDSAAPSYSYVGNEFNNKKTYLGLHKVDDRMYASSAVSIGSAGNTRTLKVEAKS